MFSRGRHTAARPDRVPSAARRTACA